MIVPIGKFTLSLTAEDSHKVNIDAGQGRFTIAPKGLGKKGDAYVEANTLIRWKIFSDFETPSGAHWPRVMEYIGNDSSFIQWTEDCAMESFVWKLLAPASVDFSKAKIEHLSVHNSRFPLEIRLDNAHFRSVVLRGNPHKITIESAKGIKGITFGIETDKKSSVPIALPLFPALKDIENIEISVPIAGQPFDCKSLLQFKNLKRVSFWGNICNFEAMVQMPQLTSIDVRYCPDMSGFPPLKTWQDLNHLIIWNAEEIAGKRLKQELKERNKTHSFGYASVSKLRKKVWFATEFNIPFANWEGKNGKEAIKAYKTTLKAIRKAKEEQEVKALLVALIETINHLPDIETVEREDTAEAVHQLAASASFVIEEGKVQQWFDENRKF